MPYIKIIHSYGPICQYKRWLEAAFAEKRESERVGRKVRYFAPSGEGSLNATACRKIVQHEKIERAIFHISGTHSPKNTFT